MIPLFARSSTYSWLWPSQPPRLVVREGSEDLGDLITAVRALRAMASPGANENKKASICT